MGEPTELSKYYVENNGWDILELDNEYFTFEKKEELPEDYQQYFDELTEHGYSMIFNTYNSLHDEDEKQNGI